MTTKETPGDPSKGGKSAAASMTDEQRRARAIAGAEARWGNRMPVATHQGVLKIGALELPCFVLETGQRVLSQRGMVNALGMKLGSNPRLGADRLSNFVAGKQIKPFVPERLVVMINSPLRFRHSGGGNEAHGYDANALVDVCEAVLQLRAAGEIHHQQHHIAAQCELLMRGLARVGITALVDEATGYQADRAKDALSKILEAFVEKELRPWVKTFPTDYYRELFRLRGWEFPPKDNPQSKPPFVGKLTNWIVYDRLAPGVRAELSRIVERDDVGRPRHKLHQHLNENHGHPKLREHLAVVVALMKVSTNYVSFEHNLDKVAPKFGNTLEMDV